MGEGGGREDEDEDEYELSKKGKGVHWMEQATGSERNTTEMNK